MTSLAWEITADDVFTVIQAHRETSMEEAEELHSEFMWGQNAHEVEQMVLAYTDFENQVDAALCEIEDILIKEARIQLPKKWNAPAT